MATYSWLGTTATWSTITNWQTGGIPAVSVPGVGDDCVWDGSGGGSSSAACTLTASTNVKSVNFTGYTGTFTHNAGIVLTIGSAGQTGGVATWVSGMTYTLGNAASSAVNFDADGGTNTLTTAGKTFASITCGPSNAGGTLSLATNGLTQGAAATFTLTKGTFVTNNLAWSAGFIASSNSNTRTLTLGSSALTVTGTSGAVWSMLTDTNLTITANTSTIDFAATALGSRTMFWPATARGALNNVSVTNPTLNVQYVLFTGSSHAFGGTCTLTNVRNFAIAGGLTDAFAGNFVWTGPAALTPGSFSTNQLASTFNVANAVSVDCISVGQITRGGAGSWTTNNGLDSGLSSGFTFTSSNSVAGRIIGS